MLFVFSCCGLRSNQDSQLQQIESKPYPLTLTPRSVQPTQPCCMNWTSASWVSLASAETLNIPSNSKNQIQKAQVKINSLKPSSEISQHAAIQHQNPTPTRSQEKVPKIRSACTAFTETNPHIFTPMPVY